MKKQLRLLFIFSLFTCITALSANAQCKGFAKKICKLELIPFIHDGNYHANILTEGEEAEMYKTLYSGQEYRIAVCGSDALPEIEFRVIDTYKNILFDNTKNNLTRIWDFKLEASQQLKISVKVPSGSGESEYPASGCVAIMFGFKEK
jgi:hypothetical protein